MALLPPNMLIAPNPRARKNPTRNTTPTRLVQAPKVFSAYPDSLSASSPRQNKQVDRYKKYIQFLAENKRSLEPISIPSEKNLLKKKSRTPTHKRNSSDPFFRNKKSDISRFDKSFSPYKS